MRKQRILQWVALGGFIVLFGAAAQVPRSLGEVGSQPRDFAVDVAAVAAPALAVGVLVWWLVALPWHWTRQGIEIGEHGITVVKRPMLWFRGHEASIPWRDVHHIYSRVGFGRMMVEVQLHCVDHELRMPGWATLVLAGETKRGSTSSRPRVLFTPRPEIAKNLDRLLRSARPDLFEVPDAAEAGSPDRPGTAEAQWVDLRRRQILGWGVLIFMGVGLGFAAVSDGGVVWFLGCLAVFALVVHIAPRMFTHQGVAVDSAGITLVQESALWFAGATAHVPWSQLRTISENVQITKTGEGTSSSAVTELMLRSPDLVSEVPNWASVVVQETKRPPASPTAPLTRITIKPGNRNHRRVVAALRAVRPDLFPAR